ncbi:MAG: LysR family transcriptional regulator [Granulosicoccus sp.]
MDLPALNAFVAVAETASFSRAAEQLFMTQPAISKRIATLEADLEVSLFDRLGRRVQLTEAGETFLLSTRRILADLATSCEEVRSLSENIGGRLRLGTSHHVGIHRLPPVLKTYTQAYPKVDLDLLFMDSEQACADIANGSLEIAIVTLPDKPDSSLQTTLVWPDPLAIVAAPDHALALTAGLSKNHKGINPTLLAKYAAVLPARGTVTRGILFEALAPFDFSIETALETNYLETIKMMVSVGLGWSALPRSMLDDTIVAVPVNGINMMRQLGIVRLRGRTLSRAAVALLDGLIDGNTNC